MSEEVIRLCQQLPGIPIPAPTLFERTARYARNPRVYLDERLGRDVFEQRKQMLCLPKEIDKDVYGTGSHMQHFEKHIANLLGKEHGLFFITGIQAQLAALKHFCDRSGSNRCAWHRTSHLEEAEEEAYKHLYGLERILVGHPEEDPTIEDVKAVLGLPRDERPAVIVLEIPNRSLGCSSPSFEDLEAISMVCRRAGVKLHCDGARLWEGEPYFQATAGKSFPEIASLFDSIYVSFYKGLGGSAGAVLASNDADAIAAAKVWRRRAGGNPYTLAYQVIDDERGFNENIGAFAKRREKMVEIVDAVSQATKPFVIDGVPIVKFNPEKATCCQVHTWFQGFSVERLLSARDQVQEKSGIRVFERLRPKSTGERSSDESGAVEVQISEWCISEFTEDLETKVFITGYMGLCRELLTTTANAK